MTTFDYHPDPARTIPDTSRYHWLTNPGLYVARVKRQRTPVLMYRVGNGALQGGGWLIDPRFAETDAVAKRNGLHRVGYWFGCWNLDAFLRAFGPADDAEPCIDFETQGEPNPGPPLTVKAAVEAVERMHKEWGRWPLFYGGSTWRSVGEPSGTSVSQCRYWGPNYNGELVVPNGVGKPVLHQFAASSRGPWPHYFDGVEPWPVGSIGPDMNILLCPYAEAFPAAAPPPPPGGEMTPDEVEAIAEKKILEILQVGGPADEAAYQWFTKGAFDARRPGSPTRQVPDQFLVHYDRGRGFGLMQALEAPEV